MLNLFWHLKTLQNNRWFVSCKCCVGHLRTRISCFPSFFFGSLEKKKNKKPLSLSTSWKRRIHKQQAAPPVEFSGAYDIAPNGPLAFVIITTVTKKEGREKSTANWSRMEKKPTLAIALRHHFFSWTWNMLWVFILRRQVDIPKFTNSLCAITNQYNLM